MAVVVLGLAGAFHAMGPREVQPRHAGRPLSHWVRRLGKRPGDAEAHQAISQVGTNAIPYLLRWIAYCPRRSSTLISKLNEAGYRVLKRKEPLIEDSAWFQAEGAVVAFRILGPATEPSRPALGRLLASSSGIGPESDVVQRTRSLLLPARNTDLPWLLTLLTNGTTTYPHQTLDLIFSAAPDASPVIPVLVQCLDSTNLFLPAYCAKALGALHREPRIVVPALTRSLNSTNGYTRSQAARSLAEFPTDALPAVSRIRLLLNDPEPLVRSSATNALQCLVPETGQPVQQPL